MIKATHLLPNPERKYRHPFSHQSFRRLRDVVISFISSDDEQDFLLIGWGVIEDGGVFFDGVTNEALFVTALV